MCRKTRPRGLKLLDPKYLLRVPLNHARIAQMHLVKLGVNSCNKGGTQYH